MLLQMSICPKIGLQNVSINSEKWAKLGTLNWTPQNLTHKIGCPVFVLALSLKKQKATEVQWLILYSVGMRRLERPTPTSRTQCATNCATFRFCFASAKVKHFFEIKKNFIENLQKICRIKKYAYLCNRKQETIVSERCSITK